MDLELISKYFILFIMYSSAGWIVETIWVSWCNKKIVDRGFLIGPYCPIYGCGAILIIVFLQRFSYSPILLFLITTLVCGILEYLTSWIMEKVFKARWWDYSHVKFNLNGRICLHNLIAFGVMGLAVTYLINPYFEKWVGFLDEKHLNNLGFILWTIFIVDLVVSTIVVYGFRKVTEKINKESLADNTEQITKMVREALSQRSFLHRRFIEAYPKLEAIKIKMKEIKDKIEYATIDAKEVVVGKVNDAKDVVKDKVSDAKDVMRDKVNGAKEVVTEKTGELRSSIEKGTRKAKMSIYLGKKHIVKRFKKKGKN